MLSTSRARTSFGSAPSRRRTAASNCPSASSPGLRPGRCRASPSRRDGLGLARLQIVDPGEQDLRIEIARAVAGAVVMPVGGEEQVALAALDLVADRDAVAAGPPVDRGLVVVEEIAPHEPVRAVVKTPPDLQLLPRSSGRSPSGTCRASGTWQKHRALDDRLHVDHHVRRRVHQPVLGREERPVDAAEGVHVAGDQIDALALVLEMADAPFAAAMAGRRCRGRAPARRRRYRAGARRRRARGQAGGCPPRTSPGQRAVGQIDMIAPARRTLLQVGQEAERREVQPAVIPARAMRPSGCGPAALVVHEGDAVRRGPAAAEAERRPRPAPPARPSAQRIETSRRNTVARSLDSPNRPSASFARSSTDSTVTA